MANYGHITSRKWFRVDELEGHVKEIIARFFPLLTARMYISSDSVGVTVSAPDDEFNGLFIEVETRNRLSTRRPAGIVWSWAFTVIQNELAVKYGGRRTDDGIVGRIANKPTGTWPTYEAWLRAANSSSEEWIQTMMAAAKDVAWLHN